jgi:hypothetical protein
MPFWVYGRDSETGQPTDPLFSEEASVEAARAEATAQGMIVESVVRHTDTAQGIIVEPVERHTGTEWALQQPPPTAPGSAGPESAARDGVGTYEFSPEQNAVIGSLAWYMRVFGVVLIAFGGLQLVAGVLESRSGSPVPFFGGLLGVIIYGLMGVLTVGVASHFRQIVDSRGKNVGHLMDALEGLKWIYAIQVWLIGLALAIVAVIILFVVAAR